MYIKIKSEFSGEIVKDVAENWNVEISYELEDVLTQERWKNSKERKRYDLSFRDWMLAAYVLDELLVISTPETNIYIYIPEQKKLKQFLADIDDMVQIKH